VQIDVTAGLHRLQPVEVGLAGSDVSVILLIGRPGDVPDGQDQLLRDTLIRPILFQCPLDVEAEHIDLRLRGPGDTDDIVLGDGLERGEIHCGEGWVGQECQEEDDGGDEGYSMGETGGTGPPGAGDPGLKSHCVRVHTVRLRKPYWLSSVQ
jgi:hypothetical protein